MPDDIQTILRQIFGYPAFRPGQEDIIRSVMTGHDTLALLPTGGGKSVCYQVPALALPGICLVITPLIALMKDQVRQLRKRNIVALAVHSGQPFYEVKKSLENATSGQFKFLYLSPERLQTDLFKEYLPGMQVNLIAVDEAHCISQWGYDFRPAYLQIASLREEIPHSPLLAVTASATPQVQQDIMHQLRFGEDAKLFRQSFERPNLSFSTFCIPQKILKVQQILERVPGSALVYCRNRKRTQDIASHLGTLGMAASYYHAGLSSELRSLRQEEWINNKVRVMVCTNAFGMGIDKPDVRTVIHVDIPDSLEAYYQEAGRAGRDGNKSYAVLVFSQEDLLQLKQLPDQKFIPLNQIGAVYHDICQYLQLPLGDGAQTYFDVNMAQFCETFRHNAQTVLSALQMLQTSGYLSFSEQVFVPTRIQVVAGREVLENLEFAHPHLDVVMKALLRGYEGILDFPVSVREAALANALNLSEEELVSRLRQMVGHALIEHQPKKDTPQLFFLYPRVRKNELNIDEKKYWERRSLYQKQVGSMERYATQISECRSSLIRRHFGDNQATDCGLCDRCLAKRKPQTSADELKKACTTIANFLEKPQSALQLRKRCLQMASSTFDEALKRLQEEERVIQTPNGLLMLNT